MGNPWYVLAIIAAVLLVPYVLGPMVVFSTGRFRCPGNLLPLDPRIDPLPQEAREYFAATHDSLVSCGFELLGTYGLLDLVPNVQSVLSLYVQRQTKDQAMTTLIVGNAPGGQTLKTKYVEFIARFEDGTVVQTNNSGELSAFKPLPGEHTVKLWEVQDVGRLFELHTAFRQHFAPRSQPLLRLDRDAQGDPYVYLSRIVLEESFADQVPTGYLQRYSEGYRPTIWGACIMTWQELWPMKAVRRALIHRAANRLLEELSLGVNHRR